MKNKLFYLLISFAILTPSCKKFVHQQEQNALTNIVTNGVWAVTYYSKNDTDITSSFAGYTFQFNANGTVTGSNGAESGSGTWSADITTRTINSDFPTSGNPLDYLNAVWKITDSYVDSVSAQTTISSSYNTLQLKKQ